MIQKKRGEKKIEEYGGGYGSLTVYESDQYDQRAQVKINIKGGEAVIGFVDTLILNKTIAILGQPFSIEEKQRALLELQNDAFRCGHLEIPCFNKSSGI